MNNSKNSAFAIPRPTLQRLPGYLNYLKERRNEGISNISATIIAEELKLNHVQVRKDLSLVSFGGRPKTGYVTDELIKDIRKFLGYDNVNDAFLIGVGKLGKALLSYDGFNDYGLNIIAAFDTNPEIIGTEISGKQIFSIDKLKNLVRRLKVHIGIIAAPTANAQAVCDLLSESGILAIWNFAPVHLNAPDNVIIQNENMAASLAVLSNKLSEKLTNSPDTKI